MRLKTVLDQIEKLEEELSQPEEPEYVWDDGSLVVDLNLPNDKTWVMDSTGSSSKFY